MRKSHPSQRQDAPTTNPFLRAVYDKGTHEKLLRESFRFCEDYARAIETEVKQGGASDTGTGKSRGKGKERARKVEARKTMASPPATPTKPTALKPNPKTPAKRRVAEPSPPTPPEATALVGQSVRKRFDGEWFEGAIDSYVHPYLRVVYSDGDAEEVDLHQARLLVSGVDVGERVQYHFGSQVGWIGGSVISKYRRGCVIFEPDELEEDSTSTAMAWEVQWEDGDLASVDLCLERRSHDPKAGNWHLETGSSVSASALGN